MRFAAVAVAVCVFGIGCSDQNAPVAEEPAQVGFTGVDEPGLLDGPLDGSLEGRAERPQLATDEVRLFPALLSEASSDAEDAPVVRVLSLGAAEAVEELHRLGFDSQETCGAPAFIPDYAEADELTYAVVTGENVALTARDAADAVWEYYKVVAQTHQQPTPSGLLCLAQVSMLPKLEWKWADLSDLIASETSVAYLLPQSVHVFGLMTGNALAVACLPPLAYGELSLSEAPLAASLLLQRAGGRWRVSVAEDSEPEALEDDDSSFCDRFIQTQQAEFEDDVADTGERWRFGNWSFTADELTETQEEQQ